LEVIFKAADDTLMAMQDQDTDEVVEALGNVTKAEKMFTKSGKAFGKSSGKASHVARPVAFTTSSTGVMSVSMEARGEDYYDPYMGLVSDESMSMDTAPWE